MSTSGGVNIDVLYPGYSVLVVPFSGLANGTTIFGPDSPGTTTSGHQEAFNSLRTVAGIQDAAGNVVGGKTGKVFSFGGLFTQSSLITIPAGVFAWEGIGISSYQIGNAIASPSTDLGGTQLVNTSGSSSWTGSVAGTLSSHSLGATVVYMKNLEFRAVSPSSALGSGTPAIVNLDNMFAGHVKNVQMCELTAGGATGTHLYEGFECYRGGDSQLMVLENLKVGGTGQRGAIIGGPQLHVNGLMSQGNGNVAIDFSPSYDCSYKNFHPFSAPNGIYAHLGANTDTQIAVIDGCLFESLTHYFYCTDSTGMLIVNRPQWKSSANPITDTAAQVPNGAVILTANEEDHTGISSGAVYHLTAAQSSVTPGGSPYAPPALPFDVLYVLTAVGVITSVSLDGQVIATPGLDGTILVKAGHSLSVAYTGAPTFKLIPQ